MVRSAAQVIPLGRCVDVATSAERAEGADAEGV